jgi:cyclopropane-fatty-acyl-phospholipid synthase
MDRSPIALVPDKANKQQYEVPAAFFAEVLGPRRKYSACHWNDQTRSLKDAQ